ncbi:MAG TPA: zinc-ribbon domain-containing protein [Longimicrobiales bacterium]
MPTCPDCGTTVSEGSAICPSCGASLTAADQDRECSNCGATVPADAACPVCGQLPAPAACATHPERLAEGACVVCGREVCEVCDHGQSTEYLCESHQDVGVTEGWAEVYSANDDLEADLVRDNLQAAGIDAQVLSQKDHFSFTVDLGDLARVRVLVPAFDYETARQTLAQHEDTVGEVAMACPTCGAPYAAGDATCGACGASLTEGYSA